jgi:hypothetical protein
MAVKRGSPQNGFNNSQLIKTSVSPYISGKHTEANSILQSFGNDINKLYLGILKPWNMIRRVSTPLINLTELSKNTMEVPSFGAILDYDLPYHIGYPQLREILNDGTDKLGINNSFFFIVLDRNEFTYEDVITNSKRQGVQLQIAAKRDFIGEIIEPYGDGWKYAVKLATNDPEEYVSYDALTPGTTFIKLANYSGEFDINDSSVSEYNRTGIARMRYLTGQSEIGISHSVTSWGDSFKVETSKQGNKFGLSEYTVQAQEAITNFVSVDKATGKPLASTWVPTVIRKMVEELAMMKEYALMWQKPYVKTDAGGKKYRVPAGLYWWIKNFGNYQTYSDFKELPNLIKWIIGYVFAGRYDMPLNERRIKIRTGSGGMAEMHKWFNDYFQGNNKFLIVNDGQNPFLKDMITGKDSQNLSFKQPRFISGHFPELGLVEVEHDTSLDLIDEDYEQLAYTGAYANSSYMIFIEDVTSPTFSNRAQGASELDPGYTDTYHNGANIVMIKPKGYQDTTSITPGRGYNPTLYSFFGMNPKQQIAVENRKGFSMSMLTCGEIFVKDTSKMIMLEYVPMGYSTKNI